MEKRNPFIASLLSIITPGLGSLYVSKIKFFYYIYASFIILSLLVTLDNLYVSYISAFLGLLLWFCSIIISFVQAKKIKEVDKKDLKKKYFYIIFIIALIGVNIFTSGNSKFRAFSIPASSMEPTLHPGDKIITSKNYYVNNEINYGDLVVFKTPDGVNWIKRVIGLPNDTIRMVDGKVELNGEIVPQIQVDDYVLSEYPDYEIRRYKETLNNAEYEVLNLTDEGVADNTDFYEIPSDHYFMMGDNRDNSRDSRFFSAVGFIHEDEILHKPKIIYWSKDFSRVGTALK